MLKSAVWAADFHLVEAASNASTMTYDALFDPGLSVNRGRLAPDGCRDEMDLAM
jgi:hypothetical protein